MTTALTTFAAPEWLPDDKAKWIDFSSEPTASEGINVLPRAAEGALTGVTRAGESGTQSIRENGNTGFIYLLAPKWGALREWLGESELLLTLRYYDGAVGSLRIQYDSSDQRVRRAKYPPGVWKTPPSHPDGIAMTGSKSWKTASVRLPMAYFQRRLNGADIRLQLNSADAALGGISLTTQARGEEPSLDVRQTLRVAEVTGMILSGAGARFAGTFAQLGTQPIVMEAEHATTLSLRDDQSLGIDEAASGKGYVHYVESASWSFTVAEAGKYVMWQRAMFPWGGNWNHSESMDGSAGGWVADYTEKEPSAWCWVKANVYDLAAGQHEFSLDYMGGARLDLLVLAPDGTGEPDLTALTSSYQGERKATILTSRVQPLDVSGWRRVALELVGDGDHQIEVLTDQQPDGLPLPADGDLSDLAVGETGTSWIQFRITCNSTAGQTPWLLRGGTLDFLAGANNIRFVESGPWRIGFDAYGIASIEDLSRGSIVAQAPPMHAAMTSLTVKEPGWASTHGVNLYGSQLHGLTVEEKDTITHILMAHELANGMRLQTHIRLLANGQSEWQLTIDNPTVLEVAGLQFPVITWVRLSDDQKDDWIMVPKCWGQVWQNPAGRRLSSYSGTSMRWIGMWGEQQGLYLGIEDPRFDDYAFSYGGDANGTTISASQNIRVPANGSWTSPVYRLALVDGGSWHAGADIYREYVAKALTPNSALPHIRWLLDGWGTQPSNIAPRSGWDMIAPQDHAFMAANRQMLDGAAASYTGVFPYPSPYWGSIAEFEQKLAFHRSHGGLYTPYLNFHLWAPGYGNYDRIATYPKVSLPKDVPTPDNDWFADSVARRYDGSYPRLESNPLAWVGMAIGSRTWRDWLKHWTAEYLKWGADGMYYDQFNMIYPDGQLHADFPEAYGSWMKATLQTMRELRDTSRKTNPWYTSTGEVCNDVYGQYVDLHMVSGVFNRTDIYQYCNPSQILLDGSWNNGTKPAFGGQLRWRYIRQVGSRFEGNPGAAILDLRRAVKSHLYASQFMDTVGLNITADGKNIGPEYLPASHQFAPVSGTIGRWFLIDQDDQHGAIVNLINDPPIPGAQATIDTRRFGPVRQAIAFKLDGSREILPGTQNGDTYTFPVPMAELSSVLLVKKLAPVVSWEFPRSTHVGNTEAFTITLVNAHTEPISGTARLRLPDGWQAEPVAFGPLAPGAELTVQVPCRIGTDAKPGRQDLWCDIITDTGSFSAYALPTVNSGILADFRGDPGSYHLLFDNPSDATLSGPISVAAPEPLQISAPVTVTIPPRSELRVPVDVRNQEQLKSISELHATVTIGAQRLELHRAVIPPLPNPDFELDTAGDGKPDAWICRDKRSKWAYGRMTLSTEAHTGTTCLRLEPAADGTDLTVAYPVHSILAPNTRYRLSVWIRSKASEGVYLLSGNVKLGNGKTTDTWQQFTREFGTNDYPGSFSRLLFNESDQPAFFDDIQIEVISP